MAAGGLSQIEIVREMCASNVCVTPFMLSRWLAGKNGNVDYKRMDRLMAGWLEPPETVEVDWFDEFIDLVEIPGQALTRDEFARQFAEPCTEGLSLLRLLEGFVYRPTNR